MGKKLVEVANLDSVIRDGKVHVDGSIILTPGAKDELGRRGIAIVYGQGPAAAHGSAQGGSTASRAAQGCPAGCTCPVCCALAACKGATNMESLARAVTEALKNKCRITDAEELKTLACQVLTTIRANL